MVINEATIIPTNIATTVCCHSDCDGDSSCLNIKNVHDFLKSIPLISETVRRNLDRPIGVWWLTESTGCFSALFIVVIGTLFYISNYLPLTTVPIILFLALYIAIDLGIGLMKGQRMTNRFISHYIYFLYTILGIFGSNNSNQPTATEVDRVL
jgi:hypothetical protein